MNPQQYSAALALLIIPPLIGEIVKRGQTLPSGAQFALLRGVFPNSGGKHGNNGFVNCEKCGKSDVEVQFLCEK